MVSTASSGTVVPNSPVTGSVTLTLLTRRLIAQVRITVAITTLTANLGLGPPLRAVIVKSRSRGCARLTTRVLWRRARCALGAKGGNDFVVVRESPHHML